MKRIKLIYRVSTLLTVLIMGISGVSYLLRVPHFVEATHRLGYPMYFMYILGTAKLLGILALLIPGFPKLREWAYAGFTLLLVGAVWSHTAVNDGPHIPLAIFWLAVLLVSYVTHGRLADSPAKSSEPAGTLFMPRA